MRRFERCLIHSQLLLTNINKCSRLSYSVIEHRRFSKKKKNWFFGFKLLLICIDPTKLHLRKLENDRVGLKQPFQDFMTRDIGPLLNIFQIIFEGLSRDKSSYLAQLLSDPKVYVVLLQEIRAIDDVQMHCQGNIDHNKIASVTYHKHNGTTCVHNDNLNTSHRMFRSVSVVAVNVTGLTILNIYKPKLKNGPIQPYTLHTPHHCHQ